MPWAKGTATDFMDFLRKFRDFATGALDPTSHPDFTAGFAITGAKASGTLTASGNFSNGDAVSIGKPGSVRVYTFQTVLTPASGNVLIGGSASASLDNLIAAINRDPAGAGTLYSSATVRHQRVTASAGTGDTMDVEAVISGVGGNDITTTTTAGAASWGGAALTGGTGEAWSVLPYGDAMTAIPEVGFATDGDLYMAGPGSDPTDEIIVGFRTYRNEGGNIFGIAMRGATQYDTALDWTTQPGVSSSCYVALDDATFDCWFWANSRRIMAAARIGTTDVLVHLGFLQQFGTRNQYPYPLFISGSATSTAISFQTNHFGHSCMPDPCANGAYLRWVDGTWVEVANYNSSNPTRAEARKSTGYVAWPQRNPTTNAEGDANSYNEDNIFESFSTGNGTYISPAEINAHCIFPATIMSGSALIGRVDGLFANFGLGLIKGDTLTDSSVSPPDVYDVFGNTWRSEPVDFFAVKRA